MLNTMDVLGPTGHVTLEWNPNDKDAVREAEKEFERLKAAGYIFYSVPVRMDDFDGHGGRASAVFADDAPEADEENALPEGPVRKFNARSRRTVARPPMRGG